MTDWRGLYLSAQWMESQAIRTRLAGVDWLTGLVLRARWADLEPNGPCDDYPALRQALTWAATLPWRPRIGIGCVGAVTHNPTELPAWAAAGVETVHAPGRRPYLVPWDPALETRWYGFAMRVACVVRPWMAALGLEYGTVGVAQPGQDAEMGVTSAYMGALRTRFTGSVIGDRWTDVWRNAITAARGVWDSERMLTFSPGDILVNRPDGSERVVTQEILDALLATPGIALGNGNLANYPYNAPSRWQLEYQGRYPLVGLTESPVRGDSPALVLAAEYRRVYTPLGLSRVTLKPDAAGVGPGGATPAHRAILRRIAAYLRRDA